ncbi:uncharacterized protein LOC112507120 isoform X2 [Cynara cardunculus var. scolymus]|uniref:uncharacterized protein LOC112507120 isoform X2 n=1 Tax=Cynara cardunculus var. scolymus TaxID=59895 RepID=UPI000D629A03|nr:uncharacterized protein LOC112507120 isoform X2 [Cynara cardunculus var. scolymus]
MDSPTAFTISPRSLRNYNEDTPRVKILCSFNGSILPRPQDGKLRYVGGETRILSVPRDVGFEELMARMKELFEGATVLKYKQPDEDLDALVSVVDDDDVMNMMEEYDKLGSGDGFTRLRVFLFSNSELDDPLHFLDADGRESERRYVDALNSLNDSPESVKQQMSEFQGMAPLDDIQLTDQYFNQLNLDGGIHSQRNFESPISPLNLHHLTITHLDSLQHQQSLSHRYNEMEPPRSPAYYSSPMQPANDFPTSPSCSCYHAPYGEPPDRIFDRGPSEDYFRQHHVNHLSPVDHQSQLQENVTWLHSPPISGEKAGFPNNILHGNNMFEGNNVCDHCHPPFPRNQAPELLNTGNGFHQFANPGAESSLSREAYMSELKFPHQFYIREHNDPRPFYNEAHPHERGWVLPHQANTHAEEPGSHNLGGGRPSDHCILDGNGMNVAVAPTAYPDSLHMPLPNVRHDERSHYIRHRHEFGSELFHDQPIATGSHFHTPYEERVARYGNFPYAYQLDNLHHAPSNGHVRANSFWRDVQSPMHGSPTNEASISPQQENGTNNFIKTTTDYIPRIKMEAENQNPLVESAPKLAGYDGADVPDYYPVRPLKLMPNSYNLEDHHVSPEPVQSPSNLTSCSNPSDSVVGCNQSPTLVDGKALSLNTMNKEAIRNTNGTESLMKIEGKDDSERKELKGEANVENSTMLPVPDRTQNTSLMESNKAVGPNCLPVEQVARAANPHGDNTPHSPEKEDLKVEILSYMPQFVESVKKAALECAEEVKDEAQVVDSATENAAEVREETAHELDVVDAPGDLELDSDTGTESNSKIEPTKAEEEAIARGLQTIKNDDLEEIRQLGSGTYGAVYHGKWKGSDVAIKRIKASCFAGKPSERERLIADFWKEALMLSSLHHPNVVSFYGIVRDGPDGSLATVTEYMVNGSLKQFLKKKDRTIDRRKRLIIAMDTAFGMEYLHGKNIVHFDLKCENLLVNMRDPHRPICKIGDLGLSKVKQQTQVSGGVRGTLPWMAPELLSGKNHMVTEKIDVYSFGVVMWELLTGDEPYTNMHCASIIGGIVNNSLRPTIPTWCDPEWKSLMGSCWSADPQERPSFLEISHKLRTMAAAINVK